MNYNKDFVYVFDKTKFMQVNKRRARKEFESGKKVYVLPCRISREGLHPHSNFPFKAAVCEKKPENTSFDVWLDHYEFYNCNSKEVGTYAHYFIRID